MNNGVSSTETILFVIAFLIISIIIAVIILYISGSIALSLVVLFILFVIGFVVYYFFFTSTESSSGVNNNNTTTTTTNCDPVQLIDDQKQYLSCLNTCAVESFGKCGNVIDILSCSKKALADCESKKCKSKCLP